MTTGGKSEILNNTLMTLRGSMPELRGALVATADGLPIAQSFSDATDAGRVAAMAATALGLGKRITERTNLGGLAEAVIRGDNGYLVVYAAGKDAVLVLSGPIDSNLGLMRLEARVAAVDIKQILGQA